MGSNWGNRLAHLRRAVKELSRLVRILRASSVYETEPVGVSERQPSFLNAVVEAVSDLRPDELVDEFKRIESALGRDLNAPPLSPRSADLDLLLVEGLSGRWGEVVVPHPRMFERAFVLVPLSELRPDLRTPEGKPISEAALELASRQGVRWHAPPEALF